MGIGRTVKRELMRAVMERAQGMYMEYRMSSPGVTGQVMYDDVEEKLNVAYVNREETALAMDIFKPKAEEGTELPVIVILHGGGLFMGDRGAERPYCRLLAHRGYLVFSLEYRLAPRAVIGQQLDDVCAGMDLVGRMLVDYDVDFSRMFLMADSAGGYLAAYVAAMHESEKLCNAIGYEPSRMVFSAIGFLTGMFYMKDALKEQIYGDRRDDDAFRKFMDPDHPEIVMNLPPAYFITSCGDTANNDSIRYHEVLKKAGKTTRLLYLGDEELLHIFMISDPEHPRSIEATDRMLAWMEEQADIRRESRKKDPKVTRAKKKLEKRIEDGSIYDQKAWMNLRERLSCDPALMKRTALIDCTRQYTYEQMFNEFECYARAFSGLGICSDNDSRAALCGAITAEPLFALYGLNMNGAEVSLFSYPDFLPDGMWKTMIGDEKITDLIISDIMVTPELWEEIREVKESCGLRNVILMHSLMGGPAIGPAEMIYNEWNYHMLKRRSDTVFMEDLLEEYAETEILYDESKGERIAFICHSSDTAKGTDRMLPFTDREFNSTMADCKNGIRDHINGRDNGRQLRVLIPFDLGSKKLSALVHSSLSTGEMLVFTFFGLMHPKFIRAVDYYDINFVAVGSSEGERTTDEYDLKDPSGMPGMMPCGTEEEKESLPKIEIPEVLVKTVVKYGNRLAGLSYGRRWIDHDFED